MSENGIHTKYKGVHRAGKHTKQAQDRAKDQPRMPKTETVGAEGTPGVYHSENVAKKGLGRFFGKE